MRTSIEQREVFHLAFLRLLAGKLNPDQYALKGGVNLRFFFKSIRYSEDMDIDVARVEVHTLKEIVMGILGSKTLATNLRSFGITQIIPPDMTKAKQTDTTQRFKVHLVSASGEDIFTKIEFSRRQMEASRKVGSIDTMILVRYGFPPLIISHYPAIAAFTQKIGALAGRSETQARDIFDIFYLLPQVSAEELSEQHIPANILAKARENIFNIDYAIYKDTVLGYIGYDDRVAMDSKEAWEEIELKVDEALARMAK